MIKPDYKRVAEVIAESRRLAQNMFNPRSKKVSMIWNSAEGEVESNRNPLSGCSNAGPRDLQQKPEGNHGDVFLQYRKWGKASAPTAGYFLQTVRACAPASSPQPPRRGGDYKPTN